MDIPPRRSKRPKVTFQDSSTLRWLRLFSLVLYDRICRPIANAFHELHTLGQKLCAMDDRMDQVVNVFGKQAKFGNGGRDKDEFVLNLFARMWEMVMRNEVHTITTLETFLCKAPAKAKLKAFFDQVSELFGPRMTSDSGDDKERINHVYAFVIRNDCAKLVHFSMYRHSVTSATIVLDIMDTPCSKVVHIYPNDQKTEIGCVCMPFEGNFHVLTDPRYAEWFTTDRIGKEFPSIGYYSCRTIRMKKTMSPEEFDDKKHKENLDRFRNGYVVYYIPQLNHKKRVRRHSTG